MKKLLLASLAIAATSGAYAANPVIDSPHNTSYWGVRASFDLSIPGKFKTGDIKNDIFGNGPGVSLGLVYNLPLVANLYLEPGAELYYNTVAIEPDAISDAIDLNSAFQHRSLRKSGLRIPIQLGYHFDFTNAFKLSLFTGPVADVGFSNDYYITTKELAGKQLHVSGSMLNDDLPFALNRVDLSWRVGVGFTVQDIFIGFSGDIGLLNKVRHNNDGNISYKENVFHFTLGYNF